MPYIYLSPQTVNIYSIIKLLLIIAVFLCRVEVTSPNKTSSDNLDYWINYCKCKIYELGPHQDILAYTLFWNYAHRAEFTKRYCKFIHILTELFGDIWEIDNLLLCFINFHGCKIAAKVLFCFHIPFLPFTIAWLFVFFATEMLSIDAFI